MTLNESPFSDYDASREATILVFAHFGVPILWSQVLKRTLKETTDDNCLGLAAQLAFYFLMALFPALLFLVALIGYLPVENRLSELLAALGTVAPQELVELLRGQLAQIAPCRVRKPGHAAKTYS